VSSSKFGDAAYAYGLAALVDGLPLPHDRVAEGEVTDIRIPHAAIRGELARLPLLWESIAVEVNRRCCGVNLQMQQFVFDAPLVRAASLLLGLFAKNGEHGEPGPVTIEPRLPQERLAELLGHVQAMGRGAGARAVPGRGRRVALWPRHRAESVKANGPSTDVREV
jgi:hypothetical protein